MTFPIIIAFFFCAVAFIWYRVRKVLSYWSDRNVPVVDPKFPLGNLGDVGKKHLGCVLQDIYLKLKNKAHFAGFYFLLSPQIIPLSSELIKNILIKDFQYFSDRKIFHNEKDDPLSAHLFAIRGEKWRILRQKLTPTFTSSKMKMMFPLVIAEAKNLQKYIEKHINDGPMEMKSVCVRFTADVIGSAAFGLECRALVNEDSEILRVGKHFFSFNTFMSRLKFFLEFLYEDLAKALGFRFNHIVLEEFFMRVIKETIEMRESGLVDKNDFMKHLLEIRDSDKDGKIFKNFNELAAQAFAIFFGGFETSSNTMEWCLCNLAQHPDIQDRVRTEVREVLKKWNGELTYEALRELTYLRQCIDETLRLHPPAVVLFRDCVKEYKIPNTNQTIEKGKLIFIPVMGIHMDPEYYPNPEIYDPDRFTPENVKKRDPATYLPFGDGPRNCIGMRFGLMQVTVGLAYILNNFRLTLNSKTATPLELDPTDVITNVKGGAWFDIEDLSKNE
ncbi:probable cytochrome P450 6a20 [Lutzomyia longipalpis]|uniref:probable cytochrome P450 6a20 n=1 Tax=Lutzomyia longipalpis TaxID=7200 RepID=UPI00248408F8|nr:probable cytochrome P450 6a20 [Lutzomyia longipalpis]